eukprot:scaffold5886_cov117-Isochrysis_galbana.AAC.2
MPPSRPWKMAAPTSAVARYAATADRQRHQWYRHKGWAGIAQRSPRAVPVARQCSKARHGTPHHTQIRNALWAILRCGSGWRRLEATGGGSRAPSRSAERGVPMRA